MFNYYLWCIVFIVILYHIQYKLYKLAIMSVIDSYSNLCKIFQQNMPGKCIKKTSLERLVFFVRIPNFDSNNYSTLSPACGPGDVM